MQLPGDPAISSPGYLSQRNENLYSHENLFVNAPRSSIHHSHQLETTQMSFNRGMVK